MIVFAKGASRKRHAGATITGFGEATGIVTDAQDHIYVANFGGSIAIFASDANGAATPLRVIQGAKTLLDGACFLYLR